MTRDRILQAAHTLLGRIRPVDLSYAQIAEQAQVSVRTVYRHFPTSDDLFLALSDRLLGALLSPEAVEAMKAGEPMRMDLRSARQMLLRQFELMEADPALYRVFFAVPTRSRGGADGAIEQQLFGPLVAHLGPHEQRLVFGLVDLLGSPYAWDVLHANWGLGAHDAWRAVLLGVRAILELAERSPEAFAPGVDPFPLEDS